MWNWMVQMWDGQNAVTVLVVSIIPAVLWLFRQILKIRSQLNELRHSNSQQDRDAIMDVSDKIEILKSRNMPEEDFAMARSRLLATLERPGTAVAGTPDISRQVIAATEQRPEETEESGVRAFMAALVQFGFFCIWGLAWGGSGAVFSLEVIKFLWGKISGSFSAELLFTTGWQSGALLLAILAAVGLFVLPAVGALLTGFDGLLRMVSAVRPNSVTQSGSAMLADLKNKYLG